MVLARRTAAPDRPDGMNHVPGGQSISRGNFGPARLAATERATFIEEVGTGGPMDRTVDAPASEQGRICGVDDGVNAQSRDVGDEDFQPGRS